MRGAILSPLLLPSFFAAIYLPLYLSMPIYLPPSSPSLSLSQTNIIEVCCAITFRRAV